MATANWLKNELERWDAGPKFDRRIVAPRLPKAKPRRVSDRAALLAAFQEGK